MWKRGIVLLLVGILVLGAFQVASANNESGFGGFRGGFLFKEGQCAGSWALELSDDVREQVQTIRESFWQKMEGLRERIWKARADGNLEELRDAQEEKQQLRGEMLEEIEKVVPEEYREQTRELGPGKRCSQGFGRGRHNGFNSQERTLK